jgi:hypothetical protein
MYGGGTPQVCAFLYLLPEKRFVVAFMLNLEAVPDRGDGSRAPHP